MGNSSGHFRHMQSLDKCPAVYSIYTVYTNIVLFLWGIEVSSPITADLFWSMPLTPMFWGQHKPFLLFLLQVTRGQRWTAVTRTVRWCWRWIIRPPLEVMNVHGWTDTFCFWSDLGAVFRPRGSHAVCDSLHVLPSAFAIQAFAAWLQRGGREGREGFCGCPAIMHQAGIAKWSHSWFKIHWFIALNFLFM